MQILGVILSNEEKREENETVDPTEELKAQLEKCKNDFLYLRAEFDTYKRNAIRERSEAIKYGSERLAGDVLTVLDNFERALEMKISADNFKDFYKGVEMIAGELRSALAKGGIAELPARGQPFDPSIHEALSAEETGEVSEGHVYRVFRKGYKLHDKLIRPAQVVVAKKPMEPN